MAVDEVSFEDAIEASLLEHGGYLASDRQNFDASVGLATAGVVYILYEREFRSEVLRVLTS